jgi:hypothetical protein
MKQSLLSLVVGISLSFPSISPLFSQGTLVKDVNSVQAQSSKAYDASELFCPCGDYLFFTSYNTQGQEL